MSFVTTACGGAPGRGSAAPPDPCPHSGAATSAATATVANHRVQCIIPTSVKGRRLFSRTQRESHIHVPARSRLIIASIRRVDNHRRDVEAVPHVVQAHEWTQPQAPHRPVPTEAHVGRPPGGDRKSTRLNSSHGYISYAVFCLKKKKENNIHRD